MTQPLVIAITVSIDEVDDDAIGGGTRHDGAVYVNGIEVFRKQDLGWIENRAEACTITADAFASRLAEVLA